MASHKLLLGFTVFAAAATIYVAANGKLSPNYYSSTCPKALSIVKEAVIQAINKEARMGASLLRLHFHDCFVNGCDGSVLLDDTANFRGEKTAIPNNNSIRGFEVVDDIKARLEKACPKVVSCADILALAAQDSTVYLGGPSWTVELGRKDSRTASINAANADLPAPTSNLSTLITNFAAKGLSVRNLVALSGAHTIGLAKCPSFRDRIYKDSNIDPIFAMFLQRRCSTSGNDNTLARLDVATPEHFDNCYYSNLLHKRGLLHSDQELFNGNSGTDSLVESYVSNYMAFFSDFAVAMVRMGNISPLTGSQGEVRINCRKRN